MLQLSLSLTDDLELDNDSDSCPEVQSQNDVEVDDIENVYDEIQHASVRVVWM